MSTTAASSGSSSSACSTPTCCWYGDILFWYGVIGLLLFPLRKVGPPRLLIAGFSSLPADPEGDRMADSEIKEVPARGADSPGREGRGQETDGGAEGGDRDVERDAGRGRPVAEKIDQEIASHRGGYVESFKERVKMVEKWSPPLIYRWGLTDVASMMLIGMGLYKLGVLTGARSTRFYVLLARWGTESECR